MYARPFVGYEEPMTAIAESMGIKVYFDRMPIVDLSVPTIPEMKVILDRIGESIKYDQPVYLQCLGGIGRTGTVVGCYLIRHGIAGPREVLSRIQDLRTSTEDRYRRSPETEEQREMVLAWVKGE